MQYVQIRAFHNVAKYGGFSKAAAQTRQSQPVLSGHVMQLEKKYDLSLFERNKKQIILTSAGEKLFLLTKKFFEVEDQVNNHLVKSQASLSGKVRIIADSALHIIKALLKFRKLHPNVMVDLHIGNSTEVMDTLRNYKADIGIIGSPINGSDIKAINLSASRIQAIVSKSFFKKTPRHLTLNELANLPLIFRETGSYTREKLVMQAKADNIDLLPIIQVTGREALHQLVANGLGIGFVSQAEIGQDPRLVEIAIQCTGIEMTEQLVFLKARQDVPVIRAFIKAAKISLHSSTASHPLKD